MTPSRLRTDLLRAAKFAARNPLLVAFILNHLPFTLPLERLSETATLLAFHHPSASYPLHILLIPKRPLTGLADIDPAVDGQFLADLYQTVQKLVKQFGLEKDGYRLIVNGGKYQDFPYLHYHLISDQIPTLYPSSAVKE
jgi:histidine triad (HIT) family protein